MGLKLVWLLLAIPSLLHRCPCVSFRQEIFGVKSFLGGLISLALHWESCLATESYLVRFYLPSVMSQLRSPTLIPQCYLHPSSLETLRDSTSHHKPSSCRFVFIPMVLYLSLLFLTPAPDPFIPFLTPLLHIFLHSLHLI